MVIFFFSGAESSSGTIWSAAYELARLPTLQDKIRDEIKEVLEEFDGKLCYESLNKMKYVDMTIDETVLKKKLFLSIKIYKNLLVDCFF